MLPPGPCWDLASRPQERAWWSRDRIIYKYLWKIHLFNYWEVRRKGITDRIEWIMLLLVGFHRVIQQSSGIGSSDKLIGKSKDVTSPKAQVTDRKGNLAMWQYSNSATANGGQTFILGRRRRSQVTGHSSKTWRRIYDFSHWVGGYVP